MNRQHRRHPIHPALPLPDFSNDKISNKDIRKKSGIKGSTNKIKKGTKRNG